MSRPNWFAAMSSLPKLFVSRIPAINSTMRAEKVSPLCWRFSLVRFTRLRINWNSPTCSGAASRARPASQGFLSSR